MECNFLEIFKSKIFHYIFLSIFIFFLTLCFGYFEIISPQIRNNKNLKIQEFKCKNKFEERRGELDEIIKLKGKMPDLESNFKEKNRIFYEKDKVPEFLEKLSFLANASQVSLSGLKMKEEITEEFYILQPIELEISGDYHAIANFFTKLSMLEKAFTVHNFTLTLKRNSEQSETSELKMNFLANIYIIPITYMRENSDF